MSKTAMQELIDDLRELKKHSKDNKQDTSFDIGMTFAIARAELRLEKEKEQIIDAWNKRGSTIVPRYFLEENINGEEYYNQTYNQKQIIIDIMKADEEDGLYNENK